VTAERLVSSVMSIIGHNHLLIYYEFRDNNCDHFPKILQKSKDTMLQTWTTNINTWPAVAGDDG